MRVGIWLILMAVVLSIALACAEKPESTPRTPEPSRVVARYMIPRGLKAQEVIEFRASNGNICVFIPSGYSGVLDCSPPLPPIHYNDLPEVDQ